MTDWATLSGLIAACADSPHGLPFWWRDDDAQAPGPALSRLHTTADRFGLPVHLAIIPDGSQAALAAEIAAAPATLIPVTHGYRHANHAPPGQKKAEFGATRPDSDIARDLAAASAALRPFAGLLRPMFVPPWNRIGPGATALLPAAGFRILSTYGPRPAELAAPGLRRVNTHVDPIDWHGSRSAHDEGLLLSALADRLRERLEGRADGKEPLGLLTHHLVHDERIWAFTERLLETLCKHGATPWTAPRMPPKGPQE